MEVKHFSYLFGTNRETGISKFVLARNSGLKSSTITKYGNVFSQHSDHIPSQPRITVKLLRDVRNLIAISLWVSGALPCLTKKFQRLQMK